MEHVVVVGAGLGGLTAAVVLTAVADRVTLVERSARPAEVGAAIALQANGIAVLDRLGVLAQVVAEGVPVPRLTIRSADGRVLSAVALAGPQDAIVVRRSHLHDVLLAAVTATATVTTRFGWSVEAADPAGTVTLRDAEGRPEVLSADLVVGADGVNSRVRTTGGFRSRLSTGSSYVRTVVDGRTEPALDEWWTGLGSFGCAPADPGRTYFWVAATSPAAAAAAARRDLPALREVWRAEVPVAGQLLDRVARFDDLLVNTVRRVHCPRWWSGRLVLLGDAAHAMAPNLGQGANSALVDAVVLAEQLRTAPTVSAALQRYDRQRRPMARRLQDVAGMLQRLCGMRPSRRRQLRDLALRRLSASPERAGARVARILAPDVAAVRAAQVFG